MKPIVTSSGELQTDTLRWQWGVAEQITVIAKATFVLPTLGLARSAAPQLIEELDRVPVRASADVIVRGSVAKGERRRLVGVAVARGTEVLFGRRVVRHHEATHVQWSMKGRARSEAGSEPDRRGRAHAVIRPVHAGALGLPRRALR